ncbi:MAG: thiosulfohydrolase SoxB [Hyphomicrobium sp.]|nr:thiosulfohydrolase SoxB [Hyphomicrobium sp.]
MHSRREFLQVALAAGALTGLAGTSALGQALRRGLSQEDILRFEAKGQVTILHFSDCHAQIRPVYFREPSVNLGVGEARGLPPHLTDREFLTHFGIAPGSAQAYMLSSADFEVLAKDYGRVGGMDRLATLVKAVRAERGAERTLLLDGGDTLHGSYTALQTKGGDMVRIAEALGVDAMTAHWEFTLGHERVSALFGNKDGRGSAKIDFLAGNVMDTEFEEPVFRPWRIYEKGGVRIGVIGQAFPYTPIANPRWMIPGWSFGIREEEVRRNVAAVRAAGAEIVVLNSHNGFDVDRKLAGRVEGIDIILTAHTHDAIPRPERVGSTLLVASGSNTKFLSRLDLDVKGGRIADYSYSLMPVLADAITPDPEMARLIDEIRAPHETMLSTELARADRLLYRRGNVAGTLDDLICEALLAERDAEICFSPGFRWGTSLIPGQPITWDDVYNATAMTYPNVYRLPFRGEMIKAILEDVADNLFNPDPYYQQGGDMVRVGGMSFTIDVDAPMGQRISDMRLLRTGEPIEAGFVYTVAGWASINEGTEGPPIWDLFASHLRKRQVIADVPSAPVRIVRRAM